MSMPRLIRVRWLLMLAVILAACAPGAAGRALAQSSSDDDDTEYIVQLIYAIPRDGENRGLDEDGTILNSVESAQQWIEGETDGRRVNMVVDDDGRPTIDVVELTQTNKELGTADFSHAAYQIEYELRARGYDEPGTLYAVYYEGDGMDPAICGATPSPEYTPGNTFTLFLQRDCERYPFAGEGEDANFWELTFMHELFHALGAVERCAPNDDDGHVDDPRDLMYGGRQEWSFPVQLDIDHDDYYGHGRTACYDIARSPYLTPNGEETATYPTPFSDLEVNACQREADGVDASRPDSEVWIFNLQDDPIEIEQLDEDGDTSSIGTIDGWSMTVLVGVPGDTIQIADEDGDCLGGFEMPDFLDIGVVWVMP